jgi:endonuclease YncB( thermonuclease family)
MSTFLTVVSLGRFTPDFLHAYRQLVVCQLRDMNMIGRHRPKHLAQQGKHDMFLVMLRLTVLALVFAIPAFSQTDSDTVRTSARPRFPGVDGDTVKFGPQFVRLFGIDAPERIQTCDDGQWHPGPLAKKALEDFIAGRPVTCKQVDYDARNKRPVEQCYVGEDDLQALMVAAGWAWSFGRYSGMRLRSGRLWLAS